MKVFTGKVISTKMAKTATVAVERLIAHPVYGKRLRKVKKYQVHDTLGSKEGQVVRFVPSKPFSKHKKFNLIELVGLKAPTEKTKKVANNKVGRISKKAKEEK